MSESFLVNVFGSARVTIMEVLFGWSGGVLAGAVGHDDSVRACTYALHDI